MGEKKGRMPRGEARALARAYGGPVRACPADKPRVKPSPSQECLGFAFQRQERQLCPHPALQLGHLLVVLGLNGANRARKKHRIASTNQHPSEHGRSVEQSVAWCRRQGNTENNVRSRAVCGPPTMSKLPHHHELDLVDVSSSLPVPALLEPLELPIAAARGMERG